MNMTGKGFLICGLALGMASCAQWYPVPDGPPPQIYAQNLANNAEDPTPHPEPRSHYGNPAQYSVEGQTYQVLPTAKGYDRIGIASWYGRKFHGQLTSSREPYNMYAMTAANRRLPIPTYVRVTNLTNHRHVIVKVNDRGPFRKDRLIDLSYAAAKKLGFADRGTAKVRVTAITFDKKKPILATNNKHYLQIAAFSELPHAREYQQEIINKTHLPVQIRTFFKSNHDTVYRVEVGPFTTTATLFNTKKLLNEMGIAHFSMQTT